MLNGPRRLVLSLLDGVDLLVTLIGRVVTGTRSKPPRIIHNSGTVNSGTVISGTLDISRTIAPITDSHKRQAIPWLDGQDPAEAMLRQLQAEDEAEFLADEIGHLSAKEERVVAEQTADAINDTLARLFVRLGPPPLSTDGGLAPMSSGDGGSAR